MVVQLEHSGAGRHERIWVQRGGRHFVQSMMRSLLGFKHGMDVIWSLLWKNRTGCSRSPGMWRHKSGNRKQVRRLFQESRQARLLTWARILVRTWWGVEISRISFKVGPRIEMMIGHGMTKERGRADCGCRYELCQLLRRGDLGISCGSLEFWDVLVEIKVPIKHGAGGTKVGMNLQ